MHSKPVIIETNDTPTAAVIWLHGLGADGFDFEPIVPHLNIPNHVGIRFIFPHAPQRPVSLNQGRLMRAWFDILGLDRNSQQDVAGIRSAEVDLQKLINEQIANGISADKIVLAGFSQGGAMALHVGLRFPLTLAGIMGLSTYLPIADQLAQERHSLNQHTPIFLAHGDSDDVLPLHFGEFTKDSLNKLDYSVDWHVYPMAHSVCMEEINDISAWLKKVIGYK